MGEPLKGVDPRRLAAMLDAREERWKLRRMLSGQCEALISVTLCIPLPYRTEERWRELLRRSCGEIRQNLLAQGISVTAQRETDGADGLCIFLLCADAARRVKTCCVQQEESLSLGRLLDVDVMDADGTQLGRAELGLPPRRCFLCGRSAAECVSAVRHSPQEVAHWVEEKLAGQEEQT